MIIIWMHGRDKHNVGFSFFKLTLLMLVDLKVMWVGGFESNVG